MHYDVLLVDGYYLYYALRGIIGWRILSILCTTRYLLGDYLYNALLGIIGWRILSIVCTTRYLLGDWYYLSYALCDIYRGFFTIYTMHYAVFAWCRSYFYYALRGIGRRILLIICTTRYWVSDTIYTMHFAVFSRGRYHFYYSVRGMIVVGYYSYYALRRIFGLWILLYYPLHSIIGWQIHFILCTTLYC